MLNYYVHGPNDNLTVFSEDNNNNTIHVADSKYMKNNGSHHPVYVMKSDLFKISSFIGFSCLN